jgi:hypothetical protein
VPGSRRPGRGSVGVDRVEAWLDVTVEVAVQAGLFIFPEWEPESRERGAGWLGGPDSRVLIWVCIGKGGRSTWYLFFVLLCGQSLGSACYGGRRCYESPDSAVLPV